MQINTKNTFPNIKLFQLNQQTCYEFLFMISMSLYHSSEFYLTTNSEQPQTVFLLSLFNWIKLQKLEITLIIITLFTSFLLVIRTFLMRIQNYSIEILEKIIFPIQIYVGIKSLQNIFTNDISNSSFNKKMLEVVFLILLTLNIIILTIKNLTNFLRYQQNQIKSLNKLVKVQFFLLTLKIIVSTIFAIFFKNQNLVYFFFIALINMMLNISFKNRIIYQQPKIQLLYLVTQFYQWIPLMNIVFNSYQCSKTSVIWFNMITFCVYLLIGLNKPTVLIKLLQQKYEKIILKPRKQHSQQTESITTTQINKTIASLGLFIDIFLSQDSKNHIEWSNQFKSSVLQNLVKKSSKINNITGSNPCHNLENTQSQTYYNTSSSDKFKNQQKNIQTYAKISHPINHMLNSNINEKKSIILCQTKYLQKQIKNCFQIHQQDNLKSQKNKKIICQLIWTYILQSNSLKSSISQNLRYFICYNFPDLTNLMKYRIFYCYYLNTTKKLSFFDRIAADISYQFLISKTALNKPYCKILTDQEKDLSQQKNIFQGVPPFERDLSVMKQKLNNKYCQKKSCLLQQKSYINSKYNQIVQQNKLYINFTNKMAEFYKNQHNYIKIFQNIKQNKQSINKYYYSRRKYRKQISQIIKNYQDLIVKRKDLLILMNFIEQYYLNKNQQIAYSNFQKAVTDFIPQSNQGTTYKLKNIQNASNRKTIKQIKQCKNNQQDNSNITCVISGIQQIGHIENCCSKFKDIMQIQTNINYKINSYQFQININSLILPIWKEKHSQLMDNFAIYEKPIDHSSKKCFMMSKKGSFVYQIKFEIFFLLKLQTDLHLVVEIQYTKIKSLQIMDERRNILFSYALNKKKYALNKRIHKKIIKKHQRQHVLAKNGQILSSNNQQQSQKENIQLIQATKLFDSNYFFDIVKVQEQNNIFLQSSLYRTNDKINIESIGNQQQQNNIQQQNNLDQLRFNSYKKTFNPNRNKQIYLTIILLFSTILMLVSLYALINKSEDHNQQILTFIQDKTSVLNQFISYDSYSSINIGMLYNLVKGNIAFNSNQKGQQNRLKQYIAQFLQDVINQIQQKNSQSQFDNRQSFITQKLYDPFWIQGWNNSFMTHSLLRQFNFYDTLSIFIDLDNLTESLKNGQQLYLVKQLSQKSQKKLLKSIMSTFDTHQYNYGSNGVINKIAIKQFLIFKNITNEHQINMILCYVGFLLLTITTIYMIVIYKQSILQKYNHSVRTSIQFRQKFNYQVRELKKLIGNLQLTSNERMFNIIKPNQIQNIDKQTKIYLNKQINIEPYTEERQCQTKINKVQQILNQNILQKINKNTYFQSLFSKKNQIKSFISHNQSIKIQHKIDEKQIQKQSQLSLIKFSLNWIIFSSIKIVIVTIFIVVFYRNGSQIIKKMQMYTQGLSELSRVNGALVQGFNINLYIPILKTIFNKQQNNKFLLNTISQMQLIDKVKMIKSLFPFNQQMINTILYEKACLQLPQLKCKDQMLQNSGSFLETYNRLTLNLEILFRHLNEGNIDYSKLRNNIYQSYMALSQIVYISDKITEFSRNQIKGIKNNSIWLVFGVITIFLIVQFVSEIRHLERVKQVFNEEYLNSGTYNQLKNENGFGFYINQAKKIQINLAQGHQTKEQIRYRYDSK